MTTTATTMIDLKPLAVAEFGRYIDDDFAREYFSDCFDLWEDSGSAYSAANNGYKVVIKRHIPRISAEVQKYAAILREYTKLTTSESSSADEELSASKKVLDSAMSTSGTDTDGEYTQTQRVYPQGYTGSADAAYTASQALNSGFTQSNTETIDQNDIELLDVEKVGKASSGTTAQEIDAIAKVQQLDSYKSAMNYIEACVFALLDNKIEGCL